MKTKYINKVSKFLSKQGINIDPSTQKKISDITITFDTIEIDPKETGPLAPMFTKISLVVEITVFEHDNGNAMTRVNLNYSYKHPYGSNGHSVEFYAYNDNDFTDYNTAYSQIEEN